MSYIDKLYRESSGRRRVASAEPNGPKKALEALQAALGSDGDPKPKLHGKTSASGGSSSGDTKASGSSRGAEGGSGADGARSRAAGKSGLLDELSLPPNPTKAQIDKLTRDVLDGVDQDSGMSDATLSLLDPTTFTPLQRALLTAVNGLSREELDRHPALLAAVRAGFATEGGQQLALAMNLLDANIVGDLSHPSRRRLLDGDSLIQPQTLAQIIFDIDPALPNSVLQAATAWIAAAQSTAAGREKLNALCRGAPIRFRIGASAGGATSADGRTLYVDPSATAHPQQVHDGLNRLAEAPADPAAGIVTDAASLVDEALAFDSNVPAQVRQIILETAKHSPTFRNMLLRSLKEHGKITVDLDDLGGGAQFSHEHQEILLDEDLSVEKMASAVVFEVGNAAQSPLLKAAYTAEPTAAAAARFDTWPAMLQMRRMELSRTAALDFLQWVALNQPRPLQAGESQAQYESRLMRDWELVSSYLEDKHGRDVVVRAAYRALTHEVQESNTMLLASQVSSEVKVSVEAAEAELGRPHPVLTADVRAELGSYDDLVEPFEDSGNFILNFLRTEVQSGHTVGYFTDELNSLGFARTALPGRLAEADTALTEAGAAAGAAAHTDLRTAVNTHGPANRAAIAEAAEASLWKRSQALAAQMLEHPAVKSALRLTGRGLEGAALAAMVYGLAKAIHTDVKNGDHSAPATRKALAELLGGLSLGVGGAAVGARVGAALGASVGPITAAVGGFVGGLFGGALGFAAGTRLVDRALENNKQPLDHLIDSVIDQQGDVAAVNARAIGALQALTGSGGGTAQSLPGGAPEPKAQAEAPAEPSTDQLNLAQRVVQAGSKKDGYANRKELIAGFDEARYQLRAGQDGGDFTDAFPVNRLIATYGASGSGALTEDELAQAIADGAFVFHGDGTVTVDTAVLHAQQRAKAGNIASRVVDTGAKAETADEGDLRDGFGEAGYSLKASGEDIEALMRVFGDGSGRIGKSELAAAIQVGAVVIAADGTVTVDRAVLALAQP